MFKQNFKKQNKQRKKTKKHEKCKKATKVVGKAILKIIKISLEPTLLELWKQAEISCRIKKTNKKTLVKIWTCNGTKEGAGLGKATQFRYKMSTPQGLWHK